MSNASDHPRHDDDPTKTDYTQPAPEDGDPAVVARGAAGLFGVVFLLVGILGFVPGVTSNVDQLAAGGHHSEAELLGLFQVSVLHNVVHLLFGVAGLAAAARPRLAPAYLVGGGVVYAVLTVYGLVVDQSFKANFVPLNTADNWLHAGLAVAMVLAGVGVGAALRKGARDGRGGRGSRTAR